MSTQKTPAPVGQALADASRKIIQNATGARKERKANGGVEAYSNNDLRLIMKEIDAKISPRRVEGEVKDTYYYPIGDKDNTYIMAIHTGSVLHRHEETLLASPQAKQFNFDDAGFRQFQNALKYGYYPAKNLTKKHQEIVAYIKSLMFKPKRVSVTDPKTGQKTPFDLLVVISSADGTLSFNIDHTLVPLGNGGIPKSVFYSIDKAIYRVDTANFDPKKSFMGIANPAFAGIEFLRRGFPEANSNQYIGFVSTIPHDKNKPFAVVKDKRASYTNKEDYGFLLRFGYAIQEIAEKLVDANGTPLIDTKGWLEENKEKLALITGKKSEGYKPMLGVGDSFLFSESIAEKASLSSEFVGKYFTVISIRTDYPESSVDQYPSRTTYNIKTSSGNINIDCKIVDDAVCNSEEVSEVYTPKLKKGALFNFSKAMLNAEIDGTESEEMMSALNSLVNKTLKVLSTQDNDANGISTKENPTYLVQLYWSEERNQSPIGVKDVYLSCKVIDPLLAGVNVDASGAIVPTFLAAGGGFIFKERMMKDAKGVSETDFARKDKGLTANFSSYETSTKEDPLGIKGADIVGKMVRIFGSGFNGNTQFYNATIDGVKDNEFHINARIFDKLIKEGEEGKDYWIKNAPTSTITESGATGRNRYFDTRPYQLWGSKAVEGFEAPEDLSAYASLDEFLENAFMSRSENAVMRNYVSIADKRVKFHHARLGVSF